MTTSIENTRAEHSALRQEILHADRTCLLLMGYLIAVTGAAGSAFVIESNSFAGWVLSPIWLIGFWYFTEKRFVIKRNGLYIEQYIEKSQDGFGWQSFLTRSRNEKSIRPALPWGPYYIEAAVSALVIISIPIVGYVKLNWGFNNFYLPSSTAFLLVFVCIMVRALRAYRSYNLSILDALHNKTN
ncbi:MAG: hypothetical protein JJV89_02985 [Desulfosarcina sp.]|nr:hypothetical protein [Desulfobacterales bacterium]